MIVNDSMLLFGVCFGTLLLQICGLPEDCSNDRSVGKALLQRQLHLGDSMHSMNSVSKVLSLKAAQSTGDTKALFESFSICGQCKAWQRFGESYDGGYLSCMDHMEKSDLRAAYSMGVSHHDKWSSDVFTKFNIPVYQYDCTVAAPAEDCAQCHFFQACLQSELDPTAKNLTLREAVNQHTKNRDVTKKHENEVSSWKWTLKVLNGRFLLNLTFKHCPTFDNWWSNFMVSNGKIAMQNTSLQWSACTKQAFRWSMSMGIIAVMCIARMVWRFPRPLRSHWMLCPKSWTLVRIRQLLIWIWETSRTCQIFRSTSKSSEYGLRIWKIDHVTRACGWKTMSSPKDPWSWYPHLADFSSKCMREM